MLTADDKIAISETLSLHGHLFDEGHLEQLHEVFTPDVVYDLSGIGYPVLTGIDAVRDTAIELGSRNPLAHIVVNIVIDAGTEPGTAAARSKAINVLDDGSTRTATYLDELTRTETGWRIRHRRILPRNAPLGGVTTSAPPQPPTDGDRASASRP